MCCRGLITRIISTVASLRLFKISASRNFQPKLFSTCKPLMMSGDLRQPEWTLPSPKDGHFPTLKVYNSLTRTNVPFIPAEGKLIRWYSCGPTVYDAAHIGHARNYMTFDIIRRIFRDYFNYDITYVMNITDIDDKIILRARQGHLVREFAQKYSSAPNNVEMRAELETAWTCFVQGKLGFSAEEAGSWDEFSANLTAEFEAKKGQLSESEAKRSSALEFAKRARQVLSDPSAVIDTSKDFVEGTCFAEMLAGWLDSHLGSGVTDQKIFRDLAAFWEADFLEDMRSLNVLPADYMTRVSEYVPEIIAYVERIISNGFAYESEGSVYFDVSAFEKDPAHHYAKLCPWSAGNSKFFEEGEGALGVKLGGKRDGRDFALWKCSKPGEPSWPSPWGAGRPGWHIECSAMAGSVLPAQLDIHSGGIDLAFPHHDNEIAQAEAHFHSHQWVNYFLHAGHVHIEGLKMSKSLKNFISIKEALKRYSARQLRFLFLQHGWSSTLIYKESSMQAAVAIDNTFSNFFANVRASILEAQECALEKRNRPQASPLLPNDHGAAERGLLRVFDVARNQVHVALCDSFDTPRALEAILEVITATNIYLKGSELSAQSLKHVLDYVERMYRIFGFVDQTASSNDSATSSEASGFALNVMEVLKHVARFRDAVRSNARDSGQESLLRVCDDLRAGLGREGVIFEDRSGASLVKLIDPRELDREAAASVARQAETEARRLELLRMNEERAATKARKASIPPEQLFCGSLDLYSAWDERGIPTHDVAGLELSKNARKKVLKEYEAHVELYNKHN